jgi:TolB-like protein/DNA-binding winged helix-turn-helix (wHTH) protein/cytochrome c-type biogenesis protein CcmH/NrfG
MDSPAEPDLRSIGSTGSIVRFGVFELDVTARELRKRGLLVRVTDQPLQILLLLLEHPGLVVTRDQLRQKLWPADTFVEFDLSLNSAVRKLREALGDSADVPRFIETLPRRGYRFIAPVDRPAAATPIADVASVPIPSVAPAVHRPAINPRQLWWMAAALALGAVAVFMVGDRDSSARTAPAFQIRSVAVLPFENLTGDTSREYLVDGMTDAIISELARAGAVQVISRTSSMQYKRTKMRLPEIARELNVDAVIEGTATLAGGKLHLTAQLIQASTDKHLWAKGYGPDNLMTMPAGVAHGVLTTIGRDAGAASPISRTTDNPDAHDFYLRGLVARGRSSHEGNMAAVKYFQQAVASDPNFARAYGGLALAQIQFLYSGSEPPGVVTSRAEAAALAALALDDTDKDALRARVISLRVNRDYAAADAALDRLVTLWPSAESFAAEMEPLIRKKRFSDAVAAAERARKLDPYSVNAQLLFARAVRASGDHARAIKELDVAERLEPNRPNVKFQLGATLLAMTGQTKAAISALEKAVDRSSGRSQRFVAYLGYAYAVDGRTEESRKILRELLDRQKAGYVSSFGIAMVHDALGDKAAAMAAFRRAVDEHAVEFIHLDTYPEFKTLASEPLYRDAMGLTPAR